MSLFVKVEERPNNHNQQNPKNPLPEFHGWRDQLDFLVHRIYTFFDVLLSVKHRNHALVNTRNSNQNVLQIRPH